MKNLSKILSGVFLFFVFATAFIATENAVAAVVAMPIAATVFQKITGVSVFDGRGLVMSIALIGVKRSTQKLNTGGAKKLYIVKTEDLTADVATFALAQSTGEMATGIIPLVTGKKFVEIEAWYDTTKWDTAMKSGAGFEQGIEFGVLGYNKYIVKLMTLLYDCPVNAIVQGNDGQLYYLGNKDVPFLFEAKGVLPGKGNEKKMVTFSAKQDGLATPVFPINDAVTFEVEALVA